MAANNQLKKGLWISIVWVGVLTTGLYAPTAEKAQTPAAYIEGDRGWLDNGTAKIAVDKQYGGAIVYASPSQSNENMINIQDKGRQIQQSYYAGKAMDRKAEGQSAYWSPWAWNPVQAGNFEGDPSLVLNFETVDNGSVVYTRCRPRLWDMNEEPAECYFTQRMEFEQGMNNVVCVTNTIECFRDKEDRWGPPTPLHQELPAVYAIRNLSRMVIYDANEPWTHDALTVVQYSKEDTWIWTRQKPTEPWAACVHPETNIGLGVYSPEGRNCTWNMGWTGQEPVGTEYSAATMHFAPLANWALDWGTQRSWRYWIIIGHLDDIRDRVYQLHERYPEG